MIWRKSFPRSAATPACAINACTTHVILNISLFCNNHWMCILRKSVCTPNCSCACCKNAITLKTHASSSNAGVPRLVRFAYATRMPDRQNPLCKCFYGCGRELVANKQTFFYSLGFGNVPVETSPIKNHSMVVIDEMIHLNYLHYYPGSRGDDVLCQTKSLRIICNVDIDYFTIVKSIATTVVSTVICGIFVHVCVKLEVV